ncbi:recombinase family protein [Mesobaculum littorinae]|uniref:Recombinase family protein n=1 Tax=Mesobaculum littorinae TaxID=2486419 RepID=A0A438ACV7_9RHOB|nr:recombinase family protein [Mesobaculum littorinae]RVV96527.1 recombinase family protein [Mesobaculum littorinae]
MTTETTALLYLRAACTNDATIAEQRRLCTGYAEARGWRVLDVVVDNGISGARDAPGLTILRERIAGGEAQAVVATDLARLSRDPERLRAFARFCGQHGADLCFTEHTVNLDALIREADCAEAVDDDSLYAARETRQ